MLKVLSSTQFLAVGAIALLMFTSVFFALPAQAVTNLSITPTLECVINRDGVTYSAVFGYNNRNDETINIPVGELNRFQTPYDRGQTIDFAAGRQYGVFDVDFTAGTTLVWYLKSPNGSAKTATASSGFRLCSANVTAGFPWGV